MTQNTIFVGIGGLILVLIALFTPVGALFLAGIGIIAYLIYKFKR